MIILGDRVLKEVTEERSGHMRGPQPNMNTVLVRKDQVADGYREKTVWRQRGEVSDFKSRIDILRRQPC